MDHLKMRLKTALLRSRHKMLSDAAYKKIIDQRLQSATHCGTNTADWQWLLSSNRHVRSRTQAAEFNALELRISRHGTNDPTDQGLRSRRVQEALHQARRCQINQYRSGILGRVRTRHETHRTGTEHPPVRDWIWDIFCQPYASSKKNFTTWKPHLPSASH